MYNSNKVYSNLKNLREALGYTQEKLAEILDVTPKTISNYETGEVPLPIKTALTLSHKYNCSLDWLYCVYDDSFAQYKNFLIDIRKLVYQKDNKIIFSITDSYWKYINTLNSIMHSDKSDFEKQINVFRLNAEYKEENAFVWEFSIDKKAFLSFFNPKQNTTCLYAQEQPLHTNVSPEQKEECIDFLETIWGIEPDKTKRDCYEVTPQS